MATMIYVDWDNPGVFKVFDEAKGPLAEDDGFQLSFDDMVQMVAEESADLLKIEVVRERPQVFQAATIWTHEAKDDKPTAEIERWIPRP